MSGRGLDAASKVDRLEVSSGRLARRMVLMALATIRLARFAGNESPFHQPINNVDRGMMFYLKPLTQLGDGQPFRRGRSFNCQERFVLLGV